MGLKASPTCVLDLDDAVGYRIGAECQGLTCMFTMVNLMRLEVSIQGVALAAAATSKALRYAAGRSQGGDPAFAPVPIIEHADVRRMLLIMRARTEAMRALVFETALNLDLSRAAEGEHDRRTARALAQFLLPVCKTCGAEAGFEVANLAVQVLGGHGYVSDAGVEQYLRDSRVMSIYEGTSGIQALDLLTRKVLKDGGARYRIFTQRVRQDLDVQRYAGNIREVRDSLGEALAILDACTGFLAGRGPRDVEAAATDYLHLTGLVACTWMWLRIAAASNTGSEADQRRCTLARFFARHLLPAAAEHRKRIEAGSKLLDAIDAQVLTGWD